MNLALEFTNRPWQYYEQLTDGKTSLAYENSFIRYLPIAIDQGQLRANTTLLHWYPLEKPTILLGSKDTRLPKFQKGLDFLKEQGYQCIIRPHGGLAVVIDSGVINLSIVQSAETKLLSINNAYQQMTDFLRLSLKELNLPIENYEMPHSYCPGSYDINVNQKKIGGSAQRRFRQGVTTAIYLSVCGDQDYRCWLLKEFYRRSHADNTFPDIQSQAMATLSEVLGRTIEPNNIKAMIIKAISQRQPLNHGDFKVPLLQSIFQNAYPNIIVL